MEIELRIIPGILALTFAAGCVEEAAPPSAPPKPPPSSAVEWCQEAVALLGNPYASDWQKAALYEKMQSRGCME
jgi:hypothetical protein